MGVTVLDEGELRPKGDGEYGRALVVVVGLDGLGEGETLRWVSRLTSVDAEGCVAGRRPRGEVAREAVVEVEVEAPDQNLCGMETWWRDGGRARDEGWGSWAFREGAVVGGSARADSISSLTRKMCLRSDR